ILVLVISFSFICALLTLIHYLQKLWLNPIRYQHLMRSQGINGPRYRFLFGNTREIMNMTRETTVKSMDRVSHDIYPRILPHVHYWANLYGANFLNWYGPQAQLVVTELELVKEILNDKDGNFPKIDLEGHAKRLLGDGLSSSKGEKWAKMRKLANNAFHGESLKIMIPTMISSVETMLEKWKDYEGKEIEVFEEFRILTSDIISKTAFGSSYSEGEIIFDKLMKLTLILSRNTHKIKLPLLRSFVSRIFPSNDDLESKKLEKGLRDCIVRVITKREMEENSKSDFLGKLLESNNERNKKNLKMSVQEIVDECKTFYFAGHETTMSLLAWTIMLLCQNQEWQEKVRQEIIEVLGQTLNMIIDESLRLYPPVPAIKRKVDKRTKLGNLHLPPHMELYISPLTLHHDHNLWGEDVHLFKPERFAKGIVMATNNNPVAFMPFGFGPRICVGLDFAKIEAKIVISMILQRYRLVLSTTYVHSPVKVFMVRPEFGVQLLESNNERDEKNLKMSVQEIVDECKTFYFAGHETTMSLLAWTIMLLCQNQEWQEKVRQEIIEVFGQTLNMIIDESLRLYPPVPAIKRKVDKQTKLGNLQLPPQMELYISPLALHHDHKIWGENVHLFKPERFAKGIVMATNNNPVAFMPFGFGPRICVGLDFAKIEAKIVISMILQRYRMVLSTTYVHSPVKVFMVRPEFGVQVIVERI
ncbi:cytochrome P450, partial [Striga asiatica]